MKKLSILIGILITLIPDMAFANGGADIGATLINLFFLSYKLWVTIAVLVIVAAGFTMLVSHEEGQAQKAKSTIVAVIIGGVIITILAVLGPSGIIGFVYNGIPGMTVYNCGIADALPDAFNCQSALSLALEAEGVASWFATITSMLGMLIIIISMVEAVSSLGADEAAYTKVRLALLHVVLGLIVIVAAVVLRNVFFVTREPSALLIFITAKLTIVLGIITLIAVAILVYAGFRMVASFGREEDFTAAKSLMIRVIIGLIILALSYALVYTVVLAFNGTTAP